MIYICPVDKNLDKSDIELGLKLPIMESFYTIQGEGYYSGSAAYFIRVAGCDVGCHWCDVKESWDSNIHPVISINMLVDNAVKHSKMVVITGGEPLMWNMNPLTKLLKQNGIKVHVETSGSNTLTGSWDWICLSPKKRKLPSDEVYLRANELKVIVFNKHDLIYAEEQSKKVNKKCILFLQPEWDKKDEMLPIIVDYIKKNDKWKISLQTHKYLKIP
ncbi:7-carboxy-7-deazaguanine synthase QueE [Flavobacteriaceae bacterium]|nr:7-carboxy-7-deazaguanine synthase QueE [Flavobacteriaceae bacterium]|tara:strand:+ start:301 stop:951 length:651 start_codon:yes stop_codon:yes gene_type:complete